MNVPTTRIWQAPFNQTALGYRALAEYAVVWSEPSWAGATPDEVWTRFQRVDPDTGPWPPEGYVGRSLSIGDVVEINGRFWTPLAIGWEELDAERLPYYFRDAS